MALLSGNVRARLACATLAVAACASGCYSPAIGDCELSCGSDGDCAGGQVCGAEHLCAARSLSCAAAVVDGGASDGKHATAADAHAIDATSDVTLTIMIGGMGMVTLDGGASCAMASCNLLAPIDVKATLVATPTGNMMFDMWMMPPCAGQGATCTFVPTANTMVQVHFKPM
jgi:hypothetical protein